VTLRERRIALGLTQSALAAAIGVNRHTVMRFEYKEALGLPADRVETVRVAKLIAGELTRREHGINHISKEVTWTRQKTRKTM